MGAVEVFLNFSDQGIKHQIDTVLTEWSRPLEVPGIFALSRVGDFNRLKFCAEYTFEVTAFDVERQICLSSVTHEPDSSVQYLLGKGIELFCDIYSENNPSKMVGLLRLR